MKMLKKLLQTGLFALLLSAAAAHGADLAQAKAAGMVGERADGYLGLVQENAPADVVALVKDVNSKRRDEYRRIAESNDLSLEEVQALAGKKAIDRTAAGHWVLTNGGWRKK